MITHIAQVDTVRVALNRQVAARAAEWVLGRPQTMNTPREDMSVASTICT